ncbi:MAG: methionyl-tRNA formyltransferase [Candidatus Krumholzibacteria bacterium]|nr:methionyl-tRNA formyltransferase [Candidatus Krumholzibacteria bacterium]
MERVVFFGSPAFALPSLEALAAGEFKPVLVLTQPDKPAGRGKELTPTPVRELAERIHIPVRIAENLRSAPVLDALRSTAPDFCVVVSFGKLLPPEALAVARKGNINLHASLLPRYRGASPINSAIVNGDLFTGITTMEMTEALDSGPVFLQKIVAIDPMENAGCLSERLAVEGAPLLVETLRRICGEDLRPVAQPSEGVVKAPLLRKADGLVPWGLDAIGVHNHIRGMNPWPGSCSYYRGMYIKIHKAEPSDLVARAAMPGLILEAHGDTIVVACGRGAVRLKELQTEGKRAHGASEFLRGFPLEEGEILGKGIGR